MHLTDYQRQAHAFAVYKTDFKLTYPILGLVSEAGEVAGIAKKFLRGDMDAYTMRERLVPEMGDVLWYLAEVAEAYSLDLDAIARTNLDKLAGRKVRGVIKGDGDER